FSSVTAWNLSLSSLATRATRTTGAAVFTITAATLAGRAGFARQALVQRHRVVLQHLAFENPDLHADDAVGGLGFGEAVVDVGAQGVQRHAAFAIPLHPRDFGAAQAARDVDAHTFGAQPHGR